MLFLRRYKYIHSCQVQRVCQTGPADYPAPVFFVLCIFNEEVGKLYKLRNNMAADSLKLTCSVSKPSCTV